MNPVDLEELINEVARSGVVLDDIRLDYVEVQINRRTWEVVRRIVEMFAILEALHFLGGQATSREISAELEGNGYFDDNYRDHVWNLNPRQVGARLGTLNRFSPPLIERWGDEVLLTSYGWRVAGR